MKTRLGSLQAAVDAAETQLTSNNILNRILAKDHTVWRPEPQEISNRLGWLDSPRTMPAQVERLTELRAELQGAGFTHALLLGMGGSSLAPELFAKTFGAESDGLTLFVLDSTDAGRVAQFRDELDLTRTVFIVATKSGGTAETLSFFKFFYNAVAAAVGAEKAGAQFIAITDPGSKLVDLAAEYHFRDVFINDPNIGGRYSVLSFFGMVPAALVGLDVAELLNRAAHADSAVGTALGAIMGAGALAGRDKLTLITSPQIASFADWAEQLIAESTGKEGKGILPVVGEPLGRPDQYGHDRLFVYMHLDGEMAEAPAVSGALSALKAAGQPVVLIELADKLDLGGQFATWMLATAVAGHLLDIQPFDQPNVESAKVQARKMVAAYHETGELPAGESAAPTIENLRTFLADVGVGAYISLQAYFQPTAETDALLAMIQQLLRNRYHVATTVGYGPRFLHSTGQLHKGDGGNGYFVQLTGEGEKDLPIPDKAGADDSAMSFDVLKMAQALGDGQALVDEGRPFLRLDLQKDVLSGLIHLAAGLLRS